MIMKRLLVFTTIITGFIIVDGNCSSENKNFLQQNLDRAVKLRQQQMQYDTDDEEDDWDDDTWDDKRGTSPNYSLTNSSISSNNIENNNKNVNEINKNDFKNKMLILEQNMLDRGNVNSKKDQENNNIAQVIEKKSTKNSNIKQNYIEQRKYNNIVKNNVVIDDNLLKKISEYKIARSNYDKDPSNSELNKLLELANSIIIDNASLEGTRSYEISKRYYNLNMHNGRESYKAVHELLNFIDAFIDKLMDQNYSKQEISEIDNTITGEVKENIIEHLNNIQVSKEEKQKILEEYPEIIDIVGKDNINNLLNGIPLPRSLKNDLLSNTRLADVEYNNVYISDKYNVQQQKQLEQLESICDRVLQYMKESNNLLSNIIQKRQ